MPPVRLIGGPRHGAELRIGDDLHVIQTPYRDDDGHSDDPLDVTFGTATYRAEKFVHSQQIGRGAVRWRMWRVYLWSELYADAATTERYLADIMNAAPDREGMRRATVAEQAQWDERVARHVR